MFCARLSKAPSVYVWSAWSVSSEEAVFQNKPGGIPKNHELWLGTRYFFVQSICAICCATTFSNKNMQCFINSLSLYRSCFLHVDTMWKWGCCHSLGGTCCLHLHGQHDTFSITTDKPWQSKIGICKVAYNAVRTAGCLEGVIIMVHVRRWHKEVVWVRDGSTWPNFEMYSRIHKKKVYKFLFTWCFFCDNTQKYTWSTLLLNIQGVSNL